MKRQTKKRNPYAKMLFDTELPFKHKVERSKKAYRRHKKHRSEDESQN